MAEEKHDSRVERAVLDPVLELMDAVPRFDGSGLASVRYNLRLNPGECAIVECRDMRQAGLFADMCVGLVTLERGDIHCMGLEWDELSEVRAAALRGRIGRMVSDGGWIDLYGTHVNILWPQLHHTRVSEERLMQQAVQLGMKFGLPGLPVVAPGKLSPLDRRRAGCVRAFLGEPSLLLLENPMDDAPPPLMNSFLTALTAARERGCAVIWFVPDRSAWQAYGADVTMRFQLNDDGLFSMRGS